MRQEAVGQRSDQWVVSVNGVDQICCVHKKMALMIVRQASTKTGSNDGTQQAEYEIRGVIRSDPRRTCRSPQEMA